MSQAVIRAYQHENQMLRQDRDFLITQLDDSYLISKALAACVESFIDGYNSESDLQEADKILQIWKDYLPIKD